MRQNTKIIVASSHAHDANAGPDPTDKLGVRGTKSTGNSPMKQDRPQSWTVEPWNGRRKSIRDVSASRKRAMTGPVPPLPGQESNVQGLGISNGDDHAELGPLEESGERGRLFVKVTGVKDLNLPFPKREYLQSPIKNSFLLT